MSADAEVKLSHEGIAVRVIYHDDAGRQVVDLFPKEFTGREPYESAAMFSAWLGSTLARLQASEAERDATYEKYTEQKTINRVTFQELMAERAVIRRVRELCGEALAKTNTAGATEFSIAGFAYELLSVLGDGIPNQASDGPAIDLGASIGSAGRGQCQATEDEFSIADYAFIDAPDHAPYSELPQPAEPADALNDTCLLCGRNVAISRECPCSVPSDPADQEQPK